MNEKKVPGWMYQEKPTNPNHLRNLALQELRMGNQSSGSKKERAKRTLRLMLPTWLSGRTTKDLEQMSSELDD